MLTMFEVAYTIAIVASAISSVCFGYAAIIKARAWLKWAERCDPEGLFDGPRLSTKLRAGQGVIRD